VSTCSHRHHQLKPVDLSRAALSHDAKVHTLYHGCCGALICIGCNGESTLFNRKQNEKKEKDHRVLRTCPLCRETAPTDHLEWVQQLEARALRNDPQALCNLGSIFRDGNHGFSEDKPKPMEYFIRSSELGSAAASTFIAECYRDGLEMSSNAERATLHVFYKAVSRLAMALAPLPLKEARDRNPPLEGC